MIAFKEYDEIKDLYDTGKYNIFYENKKIKYDVKHIGSTIYCHNTEAGYGMGAIHNFPIEYFYAEEKPIPVNEETTITNEGDE